jgi:hypothetical protein
MKTSKRYTVQPGQIRSLEDLASEKRRLREEIMKTEENIQQGYREIVHALSFKNIAATAVNDLSASMTVLTKAFSFGKAFMAKRKKKKHPGVQEDS